MWPCMARCHLLCGCKYIWLINCSWSHLSGVRYQVLAIPIIPGQDSLPHCRPEEEAIRTLLPTPSSREAHGHQFLCPFLSQGFDCTCSLQSSPFQVPWDHLSVLAWLHFFMLWKLSTLTQQPGKDSEATLFGLEKKSIRAFHLVRQHHILPFLFSTTLSTAKLLGFLPNSVLSGAILCLFTSLYCWRRLKQGHTTC